MSLFLAKKFIQMDNPSVTQSVPPINLSQPIANLTLPVVHLSLFSSKNITTNRQSTTTSSQPILHQVTSNQPITTYIQPNITCSQLSLFSSKYIQKDNPSLPIVNLSQTPANLSYRWSTNPTFCEFVNQSLLPVTLPLGFSTTTFL